MKPSQNCIEHKRLANKFPCRKGHLRQRHNWSRKTHPQQQNLPWRDRRLVDCSVEVRRCTLVSICLNKRRYHDIFPEFISQHNIHFYTFLSLCLLCEIWCHCMQQCTALQQFIVCNIARCCGKPSRTTRSVAWTA